jgi:type IV fimbrial biogenesis protein FimT
MNRPASLTVRAHRFPHPKPIARGFTLTEALICISTMLVTLTTVLPGFGSALERKRVEGIAAQLETDLQMTRSLAVAQNRTVRFELGQEGDSTCYVVHTGAAGDCRCTVQGAVCEGGSVALHQAYIAADTGVALRANVRSMVFDPTRGTVSPTATLRVEGPKASVRQIINIMGRVRSCSPDGAMPGYKAC